MLSTKSNSKKLLATKSKPATADSTIKRYKSQEVYQVGKRKFEVKEPVFVSKLPASETAVSSAKINPYTVSKPKGIKTVNSGKITNDESIQELGIEENVDNSLEDCDEKQSDEVVVEDTNSGELDDVNESNLGIINNLPKPFVKGNVKGQTPRLEKKFEKVEKTKKNDQIAKTKIANSEDRGAKPDIISETARTNIHEIKPPEIENIESVHRQLLIYAKKADRDGFLGCLESIHNNEKGDINFRDDNGWGALHYASDEGNIRIVDILIKTNADVNLKTNNKKTPLHLSVNRGYFDISKLLVENGQCTINSTDDEKNNPIHICSIIGHLELLKYLLERNPHADAKNIYGKTPIDLATKDNIKALLQEYLQKDQSQYHKVMIHTTNSKSANFLLKNTSNKRGSTIPINNFGSINTNSQNQTNHLVHLENSPNFAETSHNREDINVKRGSPLNELKRQIRSPDKPQHVKYQSNDFSSKVSTFQNNNININISANINPGNSKQINIGDKVKVTVETTNSNINKNMIKANLSKSPLNTGKLNHEPSNSLKMKATTSKGKLTSPIRKEKGFGSGTVTIDDNKKLIELKGNNNYNSNCVLNKKSSDYHGKPVTTRNSSSTEIKNLKSDQNTSSNKELSATSTKANANSNNVSNISHNMSSLTVNNKRAEDFDLSKRRDSKNNDVTPVIELSPTKQLVFDDNEDYIDHTNSNISEVEQDSNTQYSHEEERIGPSAFMCHALLGRGSFGEVYLVEKANTKTLYAMKVLSKDRIMGQNIVKYAMTERNVLSITNHPFIVKLNYAFQTGDKLFLILDYCPGGDLAEHLAKENRFAEDRAKIYLCEIILALEDLHKRDVIYRDLKPDNVVLDNQGHALLTDFGLSKEGVLDSRSAKSFCGSIAYLAPEMLKRSGHGKAVDWYLLGVLFYEMLVGIPPYFTNNKEQLFKNIEKAELQIPKFVSDDAASLLKALLQREPQGRLGAGKLGGHEVKKHKYFKDVNWDDVYNKKLKPPIPAQRSKVFQHFAQPRVFADNEFILNSIEKQENYFNGWSFIQTDEKPGQY